MLQLAVQVWRLLSRLAGCPRHAFGAARSLAAAAAAALHAAVAAYGVATAADSGALQQCMGTQLTRACAAVVAASQHASRRRAQQRRGPRQAVMHALWCRGAYCVYSLATYKHIDATAQLCLLTARATACPSHLPPSMTAPASSQQLRRQVRQHILSSQAESNTQTAAHRAKVTIMLLLLRHQPATSKCPLATSCCARAAAATTDACRVAAAAAGRGRLSIPLRSACRAPGRLLLPPR
jgi:hypothetical protein